MQGGMGAARGLAQASVEEVATLTQECFLGSLSENFVPSCAAMSLEGTGARDKLQRITVWMSEKWGWVAAKGFCRCRLASSLRRF